MGKTENVSKEGKEGVSDLHTESKAESEYDQESSKNANSVC